MLEARRVLAAYRSARFDRAPAADLPLARFMRSFERPPYAIDWAGREEVRLPFLQATSWELPTVAIEIDGRPAEAWIDTGGDMLSLPRDWGVEPLGDFHGTFDGAYGRVEHLRLGTISVRDVPVMTAAFARPVIGTSLLARFLPTIDYPANELVLRRPGVPAPPGVAVPFKLVATHLLVARGALGGRRLRLLVDSGLLDEHGAAFTAPPATLDRAGIPRPALATETVETGAGETALEIGRFAIPRLALGPLERTGLTGLLGPFPDALAALRIGGLVSHHFLRHWSWTIDFARGRMLFATH
jgi:hypothetical protein